MSNIPLQTLPSRANSKSPRPDVAQLTAEEYVKNVTRFSRVRTGVGQLHQGLADYLRTHSISVSLQTAEGTQSSDTNDDPFLTLYELGSTQLGHSDSISALVEPQNFTNPDDFANIPIPPEQDSRAQMVFLRGYPSPRWLAVIGSKYNLEPDFLARHLDFLIPVTSAKFPTSALPSSLSRLFQLYITTVGSRDHSRRIYRQEEIDQMREKDKASMDAYSLGLSRGSLFHPGYAIVRHYSTLDETHFAIEQRVTIYIACREKGWTIFVWVDSGNDLHNSVAGPWSENRDHTQLHPIFVYRPMDGLNPAILATGNVGSQKPSKRFKPPQTATLLHQMYGQTLRPEMMARNILYALNEVFSLSASSECEFLNLVDSKLHKIHEKRDADELDSLPDFKFMRQLLYRHMQQLQESTVVFDNFRALIELRKIRGTSNGRALEADIEFDAATELVLRDFAHNLEYAKALDKRCQEAITVLMSSASIAESKKAMDQQERIGKLTFLAFLFVPLSFTTSFFGMNFKEMGADAMSIWQWFLVSVPIVAITQISFFVTVTQMTAPFRWVRRKIQWKRTINKVT